MNAHRRLVINAGLLGVAPALAARGQTVSLPPIRPLGTVVARTKIDLADVQSVRVGRAL